MSSTYADVINVLARVRSEGRSVDRLVLTDESMDTWLTDGKFTETTEVKQEMIGEFSLPVESGDGDYLLLEGGDRVPL